MIELIRPTRVPSVLTKKGKPLAEAAHTLFSANPASYRDGISTFVFDSKVYGDKAVKEELLKMQADKCCFCESKITHISYGDVEHFRPKAAWKQSAHDGLSRPGYYWFAYEWSNLLLCCQLCNQRHKRNLFPLLNPLARALSLGDDVTNEDPMFINPSTENPETLIGFRGDTPYPINDDPRAKLTIEGLGLKRKPLRDRRLAWLEAVKKVYQIAKGIIPASAAHKNEAVGLLTKWSSPGSEYSAAVKCAVNDGFVFV